MVKQPPAASRQPPEKAARAAAAAAIAPLLPEEGSHSVAAGVVGAQHSALGTRHSRLEGWESRLAAVIEAARHEPYVLGRHDCFRLTCRVQEALTGIDRWPEFAGYRTKREALVRLARHGSSFEEAGDWFFGSPRVPVALARRGDIVAFRTPDGEKHLGVCLGDRVACLTDAGLSFLELGALAAGGWRLAALLCAWRVG